MASLLALVLLGAPTGTLTIESEDYGATVVVDRWPIGIVPVEPRPVAAGLHLVEVLRDGRPAWTRLVYVPPGVEVRLTVALPARPPRPARAPEASEAEPRYALSGAVGVEVAGAGERVDLDVVQRYRLDAAQVPVAGLAAAVEVWVFSDLLDRGDELRWVPRRDGPVHLEEARLTYEAGWGDARAGRLVEAGPGGRAFQLDGARLTVGGDGFEVRARGGWRHEAIGPAPSPGWLAGGGLRLGPWGEALSATVDVVQHARLHVDGALAGRWGSARAGVEARTIGDALAATRARLQWVDARASGHLEAGLRTDARGPFETPRWLLGLTDLASPAGWWVAAGGAYVDGAWRAAGRVERRDGEGAASPVHPDRWAFDAELLRAIGAGRVGVEGVALLADIGDGPPSPALRRRLGGAVVGDQTLGRWRIALRVGGEALTIGDRARLLPTGSAGLRVAIVDGLEVEAAGMVGAVHPTLYPGGGPMWSGQLGLRLR